MNTATRKFMHFILQFPHSCVRCLGGGGMGTCGIIIGLGCGIITGLGCGIGCVVITDIGGGCEGGVDIRRVGGVIRCGCLIQQQQFFSHEMHFPHVHFCSGIGIRNGGVDIRWACGVCWCGCNIIGAGCT